MRKLFSNKVLRATTPFERAYHIRASARRYGQRYGSWRLQNKATTRHAMAQQRQVRGLPSGPLRAVMGYTTFISASARHMDRFNTQRQSMNAQMVDREARRVQRERAEAEERAQAILAEKGIILTPDFQDPPTG